MFFVIEGIDGSGKSTQAKLISKYISSKGKRVTVTHEPTSGFVGKMIKEVLREEVDADTLTLQMLFIADRADHLNKFVRPNISDGKIVISDRYFFSTIAFGGATGLDTRWLINIFDKFLMPNAVFFIDVKPQIAMKRLALRGEKREKHDCKKILEKTRSQYIKLKKRYKNYFVINGNRSIKEVNEDIVRIVDKML